MAEFECRLKKYRQLKELTQEQLAEKVGVRRETIMRLEKAQYNPSLKLAIDISRAVEAPIEEIFTQNIQSSCWHQINQDWWSSTGTQAVGQVIRSSWLVRMRPAWAT